MIKRNLLTEIQNHLDKKEISLITGPRQAGKTTIMEMVKQRLDQSQARTLFLSLDFEHHKPFFHTQQALLQKIKLEIGSQPGYVFIDEIQRKMDAGVFLKGIYDQHTPYKFIVSGSGSLELKENIHESLIGRKRVFELPTIDFKEFVDFRTGYRYSGRLDDFFALENDTTLALLSEYLNYGGYPRVILAETEQEKLIEIDEIYSSLLNRDIAYLLRTEKLDSFSSLIKVLAAQTGQMLNWSELANTLGLAQATVKNYINYAEKTYILHLLTPFFKNIRKEISKSPHVYFSDFGLRNYALNMFGKLTSHHEKGFVFQNFIFHMLRANTLHSSDSLHYWRSKDKAEVDFVLIRGQKMIPIEVKYQKLNKPHVERSFHNFISTYKPEHAAIINLNLRQSSKIADTWIHFIPFTDLIGNPLAWD